MPRSNEKNHLLNFFLILTFMKRERDAANVSDHVKDELT